MGPLKHLVLLAYIATTLVYALPEDPLKQKKAIGIFNIVQFPNDVCQSDSTSMNGTCFTSEECSSRDGVASGTCADGYGVCCLITVSCGGSSSDNQTYLSQASSNDPSVSPAGGNSCSYTICPRDSSINRIRLDLNTFQIAMPYITATATELVQTAPNSLASESNAWGACTTDSFTITGSLGPYPTICGTNNGQHMIVDTDGSECISATFTYGQATTTRQYSIQVTQFEESNEMGGPPGCLQFFSGEKGTAKSFNFNGISTLTSSMHLQDQNYDICVRQLEGKCSICWTPTTTGTATSASPTGTFGLSVSPAAILAQAGSNAGCTTDFVSIRGGSAGLTAAPASGAIAETNYRLCGRFFGDTTDAADMTICSSATPFKIGFTSDGSELLGGGEAMAASDERARGAAGQTGANFGTLGFSLDFAQISC